MGTNRRKVPQYKFNNGKALRPDPRSQYRNEYTGPQLLPLWECYVHAHKPTRYTVMAARIMLVIIAIVTCLSLVASNFS